MDGRDAWRDNALYRVSEILTLGRFPDAHESDSTWRTEEVRHVGSDTIARDFGASQLRGLAKKTKAETN